MSDSNIQNGFRQVIRDCFDLFELQLELLSVDSQEARRKAISALALGGTAATLGASMITVLMIALGFILHEQAEITVGWSLLIVCAVTMVVIVALAGIASSMLRAASSALAETKSEFVENLRWIKATIISPDTSARNQLRSESFPDTVETNSRVQRATSTASSPIPARR
ncbi:putative membrane protein YqjE [Rhodopirellula rubra]|uniref:Putative membrane protein YqjE n=1 Tax=Aporhodopirellula rubra TaxID=980271 RepID=A0A7W5E2W7_9BACT|nr:phage holin family protein [Aporhodopirellula rubra]MBB3209219.1 putative membrane protein YqjE [Aporhodopirellula rubra]